MATWKKVIVSGSNAELNTLFTSAHITSSGIISASGRLFGGLTSNENIDKVIVWNEATGELQWKVLNLVSTQKAPRLFLADIHPDLGTDTYTVGGASTTGFKLSYDTGSSAVGGDVTSYFLLSASTFDEGGETVHNISLADSRDWVGINDIWLSAEDTNELYFEPGGTNITGSILDERQPLYKGEDSSSITIYLQSINNDNTAVPAYAPVTYTTYGPRAFVDGGIGELRIFVNDNVTPTRTIDLTDYDAITTTANGIQANLFATSSNFDSINADTPDPTKHYRSGSYTILANSTLQRDGYNFSYAIHTGSKNGEDFSYITNFCEWFYDLEGATYDLSITDQGVIDGPVFTANDTSSISGIKFFDSTAANNSTIKFGAKVANQYRNIYPRQYGIQFDGVTDTTIDFIQVSQSGQYQVDTKVEDTSINPNDNYFNLAELQNVSNAYTTDTKMTASLGISFGDLTNDFYQPSNFQSGFTSTNLSSADNEIGFTTKFDHISGHKDVSTVSCTAINYDSFLVNTLNVNANEYEFEDFRGEEFRIQSKSYDENDNPALATHEWDGEKNIINGGAGYNKGVIVYYSHLLYPTGAGNLGGDFTTTLGPGNQPDYTGATGEREYYRYFHVVNTPINQTGNKSVNLEIVGSGKVVADDHTTHFGSGDNDAVKIYVMRNEGNSFSNFNGKFVNIVSSSIRDQGTLFNNTQTQWIPMASSTSNIAYADPTVDVGGITVPRGVVKFGELEASANTIQLDEELIIKIVVPQNFSGYIDAILLNYGIQTTSRMNSQYSSAI